MPRGWRVFALFVAVFAGMILAVGLLGLQKARASTYWVEYPFTRDSIPVYSAIGTAGYTAAERMDDYGGYNLWRTYSNPASGIDIRWHWGHAGTKIGGDVVPTWVWSTNPSGAGQWEIKDCTVRMNPSVGTVGRPYGRWLDAMVQHEVGHCLGHFRHSEYPHIMRPFISKSGTLAGTAWLRTGTDLSRLKAGMATN